MNIKQSADRADVIAAARKHFEAMETRSMPVPEWTPEGAAEPMRVYWQPLTLRERSTIYKHAKNDDMQALARAIIVAARDAQGDRLFTIEDLPVLMRQVDPAVVTRLASSILDDGTDPGN